jgi:hypothetical protein
MRLPASLRADYQQQLEGQPASSSAARFAADGCGCSKHEISISP